jgi:hypothetical protein
MKVSPSQLYMATINLISGALADPDIQWPITNESIKTYIDIAKRTASLIEDDDESESNLPSPEEVKKCMQQIFKLFNNRPSTKTAIVNALMLKGKKRNVAEYMVSKAEGMEIIKPQQNGNRIDYTLA